MAEPHVALDAKALEAAKIAMRAERVCGLTVEGERVFCDDPRLDGKKDGYGNPLRCDDCECKVQVERIVTTYLASSERSGRKAVDDATLNALRRGTPFDLKRIRDALFEKREELVSLAGRPGDHRMAIATLAGEMGALIGMIYPQDVAAAIRNLAGTKTNG